MFKKIKDYAGEHKREIKIAAVIIALGIIYLILIQLTPFRLICLFNRITGLACPGCGITTLINRLAHFEFKEAISENYAISVLFPVYLVIYAVRIIWKPKSLRNSGRLYNVILWITLVFLISFGAVRNIKGFEFLLPSYMR